MSRVKVEMKMPPLSAFNDFERKSLDRMKAAALNATSIAASRANAKLRADMVSANLGRLGQAIGSGSDLQKSKQVHQSGRGWSASGWLFIRSRSPRTLGAIESYLKGGEIAPRRGRYLWIATDDIKRLVGVPLPSTSGNGRARVRLEPYLWDRTYGRTLGPLVPITARDGTPMLVIRNATLSLSGKGGSVKPLTKTGKARKGQFQVPFVVAFVGIRRTSRKARVDPRKIVAEAQASLPALIEQQLRRG